MELKVIFLEIVCLNLYFDKVWGFSIFSFCTPPGDIYGRPLLSFLFICKQCSIFKYSTTSAPLLSCLNKCCCCCLSVECACRAFKQSKPFMKNVIWWKDWNWYKGNGLHINQTHQDAGLLSVVTSLYYFRQLRRLFSVGRPGRLFLNTNKHR